MPPKYVAHVSSDFHYDTFKRTFPTIQEAIDYMYDLYGAEFGVTINVYPGWYYGQIHSYPGFFIKGITHNAPASEQRPVTLYADGLTPATYPLRAEDGDAYVMHNMNIKTAAGGTFGRLGNDRYVSCNFAGGAFIESQENVTIFESWADCSFVSCPAFNVTGVEPQGRYLVFENCWFGWWNTIKFESTHTGAYAVFDMDGGHLSFTKLSIKGDWYHFAKNYHSFGSVRHEYDTTKGIVYRGVTITNGIHFVSNPASFKIVDCGFEDGAESPVPAGTADITADVTITNVECLNNSFHNGLCGCIHITDNIRDVGGGRNKYLCLQCAIESIAYGESGVVRLNDSFIDLAELTLADNVSVVIDGQRTHSLTFTANIVELGLNQALTFSRMCSINGSAIEINGDGAELHAHSCNHSSTFHIVTTAGAGAHVHINNSSFQGDTGHPALEINGIVPSMLLEYSKFKGATGQPAVNFTVAADSKLKAKFSTFLHGDGAANYPIVRTGSFSVTFSIYGSAGNNSFLPPAGGLSNAISGSNNTDDNALDF